MSVGPPADPAVSRRSRETASGSHLTLPAGHTILLSSEVVHPLPPPRTGQECGGKEISETVTATGSRGPDRWPCVDVDLQSTCICICICHPLHADR
jgi:hypothetical protein